MRLVGVWSAVAFFLLWLVGFVFFARWIPPLPPSDGAQQIADLFRARAVPILIGMVLMSVGSACYLPWTVVLADLIKEIEGRSHFLLESPARRRRHGGVDILFARDALGDGGIPAGA